MRVIDYTEEDFSQTEDHYDRINQDNQMNKKEKFWDRIAKNYDVQVNQDDQESIKSIENTKKYLQRDDIVLDFGCATGKFAFEIAGFVKKVHGVDISSEMISIATRIAADRNLENVEFAKSTIFEERYEKGTFDVILAFNILHLLEEPQQAVQRIHELLKPGGRFISSTACMGQNRSIIRLIMWPLNKIGLLPNINFFQPSDVEAILLRENFDIAETEILSPTPPNLFVVARKT